MAIDNTSATGEGVYPQPSKGKGPLGLNLPATPFDPRTGKYIPLGNTASVVVHAVLASETSTTLQCRLDDGKVITAYKPPELTNLSGSDISPAYAEGSSLFLGLTDSGFYFDMNAAGRSVGANNPPLRCYNDSGEDIPANSVAEITDVATDDGTLYYKVVKPTADSLAQIVIIPDGISKNSYGICIAPTEENSESGVVVVDAPAIGEQVGTVADSWFVSGDKKGFLFLGSDDDIGFIRPFSSGGDDVLSALGSTTNASISLQNIQNVSDAYYGDWESFPTPISLASLARGTTTTQLGFTVEFNANPVAVINWDCPAGDNVTGVAILFMEFEMSDTTTILPLNVGNLQTGISDPAGTTDTDMSAAYVYSNFNIANTALNSENLVRYRTRINLSGMSGSETSSIVGYVKPVNLRFFVQ
jgi:hypothetical protein